jgi:transposase
MFLKVTPTRSGKKFLSYVQGYRDETGKSKQKTIENIGWLDELKKEYDDPIAHFKNIAKQKTNEELTEYTIKNLNAKIIGANDKPKNLGYSALKKIYGELGIKDILDDVQKNSKVEFDLNDILSFLVFMRILKPGSKKDAYENKDLVFEKNDFSLDDIYRSLTILNPLQEKIQKSIWDNTKDRYKRNTSTCYYDCTNYYFEIEYNDEDKYEYDADGNLIKDDQGNPVIKEKGIRKRGPEKNKRPDPIVEMGLLMDASEIPLSYTLFPGNESEKKSLIPILNRTRHHYDLGRTIVVADRGLNTSDNVIHIAGTSIEQARKLNGYVYGQSVRGADEEFKEWVLKQDYKVDILTNENNKEIKFIHKSRIYPKKMRVVRDDKGKTKAGNDKVQYIEVDQKQMVYYSQKYADKQKRDREKIITKAKDLISHPEKYNKATSYGVAGYVNNLKFVKSTGEIADANDLSINQSRIDEEAKYDGYYSIVTSEENLSDVEIRNIYRGLSKIEETFKVTKSSLEARPVWVSRKDHIESHFLTCFIALVLVRLLEKRLNNKYPYQAIIESIRNYTSANIEHDIYIQSFKNEVIDDIEQEFNINLSKKYKTLSEIKKILK